MAASFLTQGITALRDALKAKFINIGLSDDSIAFNASQATLNPTGGSTVTLIKAATWVDLSTTSARGTVSINGSTELTGKNIYTVGLCSGATPATAGSRNVRSQPIGVQAGDNFTIGIDGALSDIS